MEVFKNEKIGLKKTKLGWLPLDWDIKPLGNLCSDKGSYGIGASSVEFNEGLPTYIRITDIDDYGNYSPAKKVSISEQDWEKYLLK